MGEVFVPDWAAPANVKTLQTTRNGGVSRMPWASFNLGDHVGDDPAAVAANRQSLRAALPGEPRWLRQVHGIVAVDADREAKTGVADAAFARRPGTVCAVMTADCLPVLLCDRRGSVVAAAHAGWRGLLGGVLESAVAAMAATPGGLLAWLGPAIGPRCFEVGTDVRDAFAARNPSASAAFVATGQDKWLCDIYLLARQRLEQLGVSAITGGGTCTYSEPERYFSYRRDRTTGRMASLIWLDSV